MRELLSSIPVSVFYAAYICQILVFTYYLVRMYNRAKYVVETYPPSTHPKLYPSITAEEAKIKVKKSLRNFKILNIFIVLVGFSLILTAILTNYQPVAQGEENFIALYAMFQFTPLILMEIGSFKHFKRMRAANLNSTRKADLQPRRFFDFISPGIFGVAVIMFFACFAFVIYIDDEYVLIYTLVGVHVYFAALVLWQMYGKKLDPHQASKDRITQISIVVKSAVYTSIGISLFFMSDAAVEEFDLAYLDPLLISVYFQLIAIFGIGTIIRIGKIENVDFDVYKADTSTH